MSIAFDPATPVPPWRVGVFVSSSRRPKHVLMLAVGDDQIEEYRKHPDFVRWIARGPVQRRPKTRKPGPGTLASLKVVCPHCGASPGGLCQNPDGTARDHSHSKRFKAAKESK